MKMTIETCREIAARIWCDKECGQLEMNTERVEEIAEILFIKFQVQGLT